LRNKYILMWGGNLSFPIKKFIALIVMILLGIININLVFSMQNVFLEYDLLGNLIVGKDNSYEYDSLNQLEKVYSSTGVLLEEYFYDESGSRIKKIEYLNEVQTTYYVGDFIRVVNSSGEFDQVYYYNSIQQVGKKDFDGEMYFYHPDHLGSTNLMTNSAGEIVEETRYLPFGAVIFRGDEKFLYNGKELDKTGLYYYGARYYDSFLRKFTQPDSVIPSVYDPQSLNKYSYVKNNPYKYIDPSGNYVESAIDMSLIGYDLTQLSEDPYNAINWLALIADGAGLVAPVVTGAGPAVRVGAPVVADAASAIVQTTKKTAKTVLNYGSELISKGWDEAARYIDELSQGTKTQVDELLTSGYPKHIKDPSKIGLGGPGKVIQTSDDVVERFRFDTPHQGYDVFHYNHEYYKLDPEVGKLIKNVKGKIEPYKNSHIVEVAETFVDIFKLLNGK
jgi:RHS repeat-associated protein